MDNTELILDRLTAMERALRADINGMERALRADIKELKSEVNKISTKQEMTWQAVKEIHKELTENSEKIKIIDNKVKAL